MGLTFDAIYVNSYEEPKAGGHSLLAVHERVAGFAGDDPAAMSLHTLLVMFRSNLTFDVMTQISSTQDLPEIIFCSAGEKNCTVFGHPQLQACLIFTHHHLDPVGQGLSTVPGTGKASIPSRADNEETHELAFSTNLMVSSQSLSSVLRKEKLKLAKSFSLFSFP